MSEISDIFEGLPGRFVRNGIRDVRRFYFELDDDEKWIVVLSPEACEVRPGSDESADCVLRGSKALFLDVWNGRYVPTIVDFVTGRIRSNNPLLVKEFLAAFGNRV